MKLISMVLVILFSSNAYAGGLDDILGTGLGSLIRETERSQIMGVPYDWNNVKDRMISTGANVIIEEIGAPRRRQQVYEDRMEQEYQAWASREEERRMRRHRAIVEETFNQRYQREVVNGERFK